MSRMRQKRKARGEAERQAAAAADALVEQAGDSLEIVEEDAPEEAPEGEPELAAEAEAELEAAPEEEPEAEEASTQTLEGPELERLVEALIFATDKPVTMLRLRQLTRVGDVSKIQAAIDALKEHYATRGIVLQEVSGGFLFRTHHAYSTWVQQLIQGRPVRLSRAQLETLAIVAYRQPITRPEIDQIRGVDSGGTLKVLLERQLIRILGKKEEVGRPLLYGTTKDFLDFFSLNDLRELPTLREYSELSEESRQVVEKTLSGAEDGARGGEGIANPPHMPSVDAEFAQAQAKIDAAVGASDAFGDHPGEIMSDLPIGEPEEPDLRDGPVEPIDDAAP